MEVSLLDNSMVGQDSMFGRWKFGHATDLCLSYTDDYSLHKWVRNIVRIKLHERFMMLFLSSQCWGESPPEDYSELQVGGS